MAERPSFLKMHTIQQALVKHYFKNGDGFTVTIRKLCLIFGKQNVPSASTMKKIIKKFLETGSVIDFKPFPRVRTSHSIENIRAVR